MENEDNIPIMKEHTYWMEKAISQAKISNTPYGAVIVNQEKNFIQAYNTVANDGATAHAEMNALNKLKDLHYDEAQNLTLYTTVEPCPMCMSAIVWAGIGTVVFGASIEDASQFGKQIFIKSDEVVQQSWYDVSLVKNVNRESCLALF